MCLYAVQIAVLLRTMDLLLLCYAIGSFCTMFFLDSVTFVCIFCDFHFPSANDIDASVKLNPVSEFLYMDAPGALRY